MIIRHAEDVRENQSVENTFVAYDDIESFMGSAEVVPSMCDTLCPSRPHHLLIKTRCDDESFDALIGAATARALQLARLEPGLPARIYTQCYPDDEETMSRLETLGYRDDDGLIRMKRTLHRGPIVAPLPQGLTIVRDYLLDENESMFFLERYNAMFARQRDMDWLRGIKALPNFARLLIVAPEGLAGELLVWSDGDYGVAGIIQTTPAWQMRGVGSYLMELARLYWLEKGLYRAYFDVWARLTGAVKLAASSGFRPDATLMKYPGIDVY
ncbi:MAG: hypothetical protein Q4D04_00125 [Clostridia bacterium]|nr:hypothetical protein [Clostridia bacterium]